MWSESDREWRAELWRYTLDTLPVEALVNLPGRGFSLRGEGNASIYADDIDERMYARMLNEWSALLDCDAQLLRELNLDALKRRFNDWERELSFQLPTNIGELTVRVSFRGAPEEKPFIIRLERQSGAEYRAIPYAQLAKSFS